MLQMALPRTMLLLLVAAALCSVAAVENAAAAERSQIALIIGNASYATDWGKLPNPANDARLMQQSLTHVGFRVTLLIDADQRRMKAAISNLGDELRRAGKGAVGLFYFAGHGFQERGDNWLVPVGAAIRKPADADLEAVAVSSVLNQMEFAGNAVNIVILDACRNDKFHRGPGGGLVQQAAPRGSFIAFATGPGQVSLDGTTGNSPYTRAVAEEIRRGGAPIEVIFRRIRERVLRDTENTQTPWDSSSLTGEYYFGPGDGAPPPSPGGTSRDMQELAAWQSLGSSPSKEELDAFLNEFPSGKFAGIARAKLAALRKPQAPTPSPERTALPSPAHGPSFDCRVDKSVVEQAICGSPELSERDRRMADIYQRIKSRLTGADRTTLVQSQRNWLVTRRYCANAADINACLRQLYDARIVTLQDRLGAM
jgi:uncharacterized caspase-like protein